MYGEKDQNLLAEVYRQILNEETDFEREDARVKFRERRVHLKIFLKQVNGFSGPIKEKYRDQWATFYAIKAGAPINNEQEERALVRALMQIADDPLSDTSEGNPPKFFSGSVSLGTLKEQIVGFLKQYYPRDAREIGRTEYFSPKVVKDKVWSDDEAEVEDDLALRRSRNPYLRGYPGMDSKGRWVSSEE